MTLICPNSSVTPKMYSHRQQTQQSICCEVECLGDIHTQINVGFRYSILSIVYEKSGRQHPSDRDKENKREIYLETRTVSSPETHLLLKHENRGVGAIAQ